MNDSKRGSEILVFAPNPEKMTFCSKMGISEPLKSRFLRQILINAVISKYWDFNRIFMDLAQKSGFQRYLKSRFFTAHDRSW